MKYINTVLELFNKYPFTTLTLFLSIFLFFYCNRFSELVDTENSYFIESELDCPRGHHRRILNPKNKDRFSNCKKIWYVCVTYYPDYAEGESETTILSKGFKSNFKAEQELKKIINKHKYKLRKLDFLQFRWLGSFLYLPSFGFFIIGIYDIYRITKTR